MVGTNTQNARKQTVWSGKISLEQKRARNRESQRSFRERRMLRVQELEAQVQALSAGADERDAKLIAENNTMKERWIRARQQVAQMDMMLKNLKETLYTGLDSSKSPLSAQGSPSGTAVDGSDKAVVPQDFHRDGAGTSGEEIDIIYSRHPHTVFRSQSLTSEGALQHIRQGQSLGIDLDLPGYSSFDGLASFHDAFEWPSVASTSSDSELCLGGLETSRDFTSIVEQLSEPYVAGSDGPPNIIQCSQVNELQPSAMDGHLAGPGPFMQAAELQPLCNSVSEFLEGMESSLIAFIRSLGEQVSKDFLDKACLVFMIFFSRYAWPGPAELFFGTFCYAMAEHMVLWRLGQGSHAAISLPMYLTPSKFQLSIQHPLMLEWVSITPLRERMIQNFKCKSESDQVWIDLLAHAVVEIEEISAIIMGVGHGRGFLGIWNIFNVFETASSSNQPQKHTSQVQSDFPELSKLDNLGLLRVYRMPLPDTMEVSTDTAPRLGRWEPVTTQQLFSSPLLAKKLYYHLELYNSHKSWRLDPAFFEKYQSLTWEGYQKYTARGICLRTTPDSLPARPEVSREDIFNEFHQALLSISDSMIL